MLIKPNLQASAKILVIGVGGGGNNAINNMVLNNIEGVQFVAINTDAQALNNSLAEIKLPIGEKITNGLGAGGNPEIGKKAAEESVDMIHELVAGADMVIVTAGMGGGTGTGAAPVVAGIAKQLGALTIAVVTTPFVFEGSRRMNNASQGLNELRDKVDAVITIPDQRLLEILDRRVSFLDALKQSDDVLGQAIKSIAEIITVPGMINVDFADVKSIMYKAGSAMMGIGQSNGENRAIDAAKMAISSELLDTSIEGSTGILLSISGPSDMSILEIGDAADVVREYVHPDAEIIFGANIDDSLNGEVKVTVIATGFKDKTRINNVSSNVTSFGVQRPQLPPAPQPQNINPEPLERLQTNQTNQPQLQQPQTRSNPISQDLSKYLSSGNKPQNSSNNLGLDEQQMLDVPAYMRKKKKL